MGIAFLGPLGHSTVRLNKLHLKTLETWQFQLLLSVNLSTLLSVDDIFLEFQPSGFE